MAFIKREDLLNLGLDDDIYNAFITKSLRSRQLNSEIQSQLAENGQPITQLPNGESSPASQSSSVEAAQIANACNRNQPSHQEFENRLPDNQHIPFQIKTESEDWPLWPGQEGYVANGSYQDPILPIPNNSSIGRSNQNNAIPQDLTSTYNNSLLYQNFPSPSSYQQVLPLDFYNRHQQAIANSFLSAYSNNANISNSQYLRPLSESPINPTAFNNKDGQVLQQSTNNLKKKDGNQMLDDTKQMNGDAHTFSQAIDATNKINGFPLLSHNPNDPANQPIDFGDKSQLRKIDNDNTNLNSKIESLLANGLKYGMNNTGRYDPKNQKSFLSDRLDLCNGNNLENIANPLQLTKDNNLPLKCWKCNFGCDSDAALKEHSAICNGFLQNMTDIQLRKGDLGETDGLNDPESRGKYSCDNCRYSCQSPAILKIHERTHSGEKPFGCAFCDYKSGQKNNIAKHVMVHMKEKPYRCQYCEYRCAQKNNLVVHERTHTGEKPFACTFCEYKTVQKPNLVKHMYLHTNEKPFSCDVCDYRCVQKTNLMKHKQKHSLEKPFECTDCSYRCSQKANLNKHQYLHSKDKPFTCELCPYRCVQKCNLLKHRHSKHSIVSFEVSPSDVGLNIGQDLRNVNEVKLEYSPFDDDRAKEESSSSSANFGSQNDC